MAKRNPAAELIEATTPTQAEADIQDFLENIGPGETIVEVFRMRDDGRRPNCGKVTLDILMEDCFSYLRDKFGPGRYLLRFKGEDRRYLPKSKVLEVEGEAPKVFEPSLLQHPSSSNSNGSSDTMLTMMMSQMQFQQNMILSLIQNGKSNGPDLTSLISVLKPADPMAMLGSLSTMLTALRPTEGKQTSIGETLEVIKTAKELVGDGGSGSSNTDSYLAVGSKLLDTIGKIASNRQASAPQPNPPAESASVRSYVEPAALPSPQPAEPKPDTEEIMIQWLKVGLSTLKQKARAGKDPDVWIDYIFDNQEEPWCTAILQAMEKGVTLDHLYAFDPEFKDDPVLSGFIGKVYEGLHAELPNSERGEDVDTAGAGGNVADPPPDATAGASPEPEGEPVSKGTKKSGGR